MKGSLNQQNQQQRNNVTGQQQRPEIRDNLDSRKNLEQDFKGSDVTHNKKDVRNQPGRSKK